MKILFRCDGGVVRGSGHLVRCMTLAEVLKQAGHSITFACRADAGPLLGLIEDKGFHLFVMPAPDAPPVKTEEIWPETTQAADFHLCHDLLKDQSFDWIILDHYGLSRPWGTLARTVTRKIMVIDDLANRPHECDILLDQNEYVDKDTRYAGLLPEHCQTLLGGKYALLRAEFQEARARLSPPRPAVKNILILMGSTDYHGISLRLMNILSPLLAPHDLTVDIVIGLNNQQRDKITAIAAAEPAFKLHLNHQKISELMLTADLAFGAGGTATWELCCLGVPTMMITFADNQIKIAESAHHLKFAHYLGHYDQISDAQIEKDLIALIENLNSRTSLSDHASAVVDGLGKTRVYERMTS